MHIGTGDFEQNRIKHKNFKRDVCKRIEVNLTKYIGSKFDLTCSESGRVEVGQI